MSISPVSQLGPVNPCGQAQTFEAIQAPPFLQPSLQNAETIKENHDMIPHHYDGAHEINESLK